MLNQNNIKFLLNKQVEALSSDITNSEHVRNPGSDFSRNSKCPAKHVIMYHIQQGPLSTNNNLLDFYDHDPERMITASGLRQQMKKLLPSALQEIFYGFNEDLREHMPGPGWKYRPIIIDGSVLPLPTLISEDAQQYLVQTASLEKPYYAMHLTASYDLEDGRFLDAVIQPGALKDEYDAFVQLVDRCPRIAGESLIFLADRGFCSYNVLAHLINNEQFFVIRSKDTTSNGLLSALGLPEKGTFDRVVTVIIVRKKAGIPGMTEGIVRVLNGNRRFDFLEPDSDEIFIMTFRAIRYKLENGDYECVVTNLPESEFSVEKIGLLYGERWILETSFELLKSHAGLEHFHSRDPQVIACEIWGRLIACNYTFAMMDLVDDIFREATKDKDLKYDYFTDFSTAIHAVRYSLNIRKWEEHTTNVVEICLNKRHAVRWDRKGPPRKNCKGPDRRQFNHKSA